MSENFDRLVAIMARLRDPEGGCPWDVEQTFASIVPHTIEEAYEVADAVEQGDMDALRDELGDLLLQVVFHAQMATEAGHFDAEAVIGAIADKLVRRHPHVFGDDTRSCARGAHDKIKNAADQLRAWEDIKAAERAGAGNGQGAAAVPAPVSALDGVASGLPALTRALKLQKRAARVGFDWTEAIRILDKLREETREMEAEIKGNAPAGRLKDELGDLLFVCVNLARRLEVDPESALRHANAKFERRFKVMEALLAAQGKKPQDTPLDAMEALWVEAKKSDPKP